MQTPRFSKGVKFTHYATKKPCEIVGHRFITDTYDNSEHIQYVIRLEVAGQEVINHEVSESIIVRSCLPSIKERQAAKENKTTLDNFFGL